jgi:hypothetical protein
MIYFIVQGLGDEQHHRDSRGHLPASQQPQRFVSKFFRTIKETIHQEFSWNMIRFKPFFQLVSRKVPVYQLK